ncbi:hypothetical protein M3231_10980 [Neobacillus mesonae]|nr:hypothetical protein [Neobacillus mesonae]
MKLNPEYAQTLIVGVIFRNTWNWYVTEREYWFLNVEMEDRFGIEVLDETTASEFLGHITELRVPTSDLRQLLNSLTISQNDDLLEYYPAIYVNFDKRIFYSSFPEPMSFEHYAPPGWTSEYRSFLDNVPEEEKYWMMDGADFFEENWRSNS